MKFDFSHVASLLAVLITGWFAIQAKLREGKTSTEVAQINSETTVEVAEMNNQTALINSLLADIQAQKADIATLKTEISQERAGRIALENTVLDLKKELHLKDLEIVKLSAILEKKRQEWEEQVTQLHDENMLLRASLARLREDHEALLAKYETMTLELNALKG